MLVADNGLERDHRFVWYSLVVLTMLLGGLDLVPATAVGWRGCVMSAAERVIMVSMAERAVEVGVDDLFPLLSPSWHVGRSERMLGPKRSVEAGHGTMWWS